MPVSLKKIVMESGIFHSVLLTEEAHARLFSIMALFITVSLPVWFLLIVSFYRTPGRGWRSIIIPFSGGMAIGMAALTITLGVLTRTPFNMELPHLYRWAWFRGPDWPMLIAVPLLVLRYIKQPTSYSRIREIAAWLSGTIFIYTLWYAVTPESGFNAYRLFFVPILWIGCAGSVTWLLDRGFRIDSWVRYLLFAGAAAVPSLMVFLPVIYVYGDVIYAYLPAVFMAVISTFLIFLDSRGRFS